MGTARAMQLCWVILGFLLFRGHSSQLTTTQTSSSQGGLGSLSPTTEPVSSNPGYIPSSEVNSPSHLASTGTPGEMGFYHFGQAGLKLLTSSDPPVSAAQDTFQNVPPNSTTMSLSMREDATILPSPTSETVLTVAAFGVISFIVILVVVVIVLVGVVSLRFKCRKSKESEDPQKPGSSGLPESCSTANGEKDRITLISMKNINMNNGKQSLSAEKVL
ncbi:endothelial cell-specific chemotaxis regulator isoform X1 [Chlorocebus sabaeus]|uniref:endothelial cell-specific chemotaxis regulator isoform X1 n=1 Tax=Chlorocebus sabaeus TaxID=60711 RepID=UPI003BFA0198